MRESGENYLETIYRLTMNGGAVRSVDIAAELGISRPSVFRALETLKELGYIEKEFYGAVRLSESGVQKAKEIMFKHTVITEFLIKSLGIDTVSAETDACRIEHIIQETTVQKMLVYNEAH